MTTEPINLPDDLDAAAEDLIAQQIEQELHHATETLLNELIGEGDCGCITAGEDEQYEDTGEYDAEHEDQVRSLCELGTYYDEAGPRSDPDGEYLCGTCKLRNGDDKCLWVDGDISFKTGSCDIYMIGEPLPQSFELKEKYSKLSKGYVERPEAKRMGCKACKYSSEAKKPDQDGREAWCAEWGMHIRPTACCDRHKGKDMIVFGDT